MINKCPNSIEELEHLEQLLPFCRKELYAQAKAKIDSGNACSLREASRQLGEETGRKPEAIRRSVQKEVAVGAPPLVGTSKYTPKNEAPKAHVARNTGNNEWYTPVDFIESTLGVFGDIDLDPASSDIANQTVGAKKYYTKKDNGLVQPWFGRIFLNPPYSQPLIQQFSDKLCSVWQDGDISDAIVLVNNATETQWFQAIARLAAMVCFVQSRIKFLDETGNPCGAPLQGQAILYLGEDTVSFFDMFKTFGVIYRNV